MNATLLITTIFVFFWMVDGALSDQKRLPDRYAESSSKHLNQEQKRETEFNDPSEIDKSKESIRGRAIRKTAWSEEDKQVHQGHQSANGVADNDDTDDGLNLADLLKYVLSFVYKLEEEEKNYQTSKHNNYERKPQTDNSENINFESSHHKNIPESHEFQNISPKKKEDPFRKSQPAYIESYEKSHASWLDTDIVYETENLHSDESSSNNEEYSYEYQYSRSEEQAESQLGDNTKTSVENKKPLKDRNEIYTPKIIKTDIDDHIHIPAENLYKADHLQSSTSFPENVTTIKSQKNQEKVAWPRNQEKIVSEGSEKNIPKNNYQDNQGQSGYKDFSHKHFHLIDSFTGTTKTAVKENVFRNNEPDICETSEETNSIGEAKPDKTVTFRNKTQADRLKSKPKTNDGNPQEGNRQMDDTKNIAHKEIPVNTKPLIRNKVILDQFVKENYPRNEEHQIVQKNWKQIPKSKTINGIIDKKIPVDTEYVKMTTESKPRIKNDKIHAEKPHKITSLHTENQQEYQPLKRNNEPHASIYVTTKPKAKAADSGNQGINEIQNSAYQNTVRLDIKPSDLDQDKSSPRTTITRQILQDDSLTLHGKTKYPMREDTTNKGQKNKASSLDNIPKHTVLIGDNNYSDVRAGISKQNQTSIISAKDDIKRIHNVPTRNETTISELKIQPPHNHTNDFEILTVQPIVEYQNNNDVNPPDLDYGKASGLKTETRQNLLDESLLLPRMTDYRVKEGTIDKDHKSKTSSLNKNTKGAIPIDDNKYSHKRTGILSEKNKSGIISESGVKRQLPDRNETIISELKNQPPHNHTKNAEFSTRHPKMASLSLENIDSINSESYEDSETYENTLDSFEFVEQDNNKHRVKNNDVKKIVGSNRNDETRNEIKSSTVFNHRSKNGESQETYGTILEYLYKHSDNAFITSLKELSNNSSNYNYSINSV